MKKGKNRKQQSNDELDLSHLNETVEETERRRDAEANLTQLHGRNAASPDFDAPFAAGLGSAGVIPNDEDGNYGNTGSGIRFDLGDGSIEGMSDLNDVSGNPEVYNGPANLDELAELSEGGIGGMSIMHVNDIEHGTGALPEEVKEHEAKRTAQRVHFKKTEGNPLLEPAPRNKKDNGVQRKTNQEASAAVRSGRTPNKPPANQIKSETKVDTRRGIGGKTASAKRNSTTPTKATKSSPKKSSTKSSVKKTSAKKSGAKNGAVKQTAIKKSTSKKSSTKKSSAKKSSSKKTSVKKSTAKKSPSKKVTSKKSASTKSSRGASKKNSRTADNRSRRSR